MRTSRSVNSDNRTLEDRQQIYFQMLLWATAGLSAVKFLGSTLFWMKRKASW